MTRSAARQRFGTRREVSFLDPIAENLEGSPGHPEAMPFVDTQWAAARGVVVGMVGLAVVVRFQAGRISLDVTVAETNESVVLLGYPNEAVHELRFRTTVGRYTSPFRLVHRRSRETNVVRFRQARLEKRVRDPETNPRVARRQALEEIRGVAHRLAPAVDEKGDLNRAGYGFGRRQGLRREGVDPGAGEIESLIDAQRPEVHRQTCQSTCHEGEPAIDLSHFHEGASHPRELRRLRVAHTRQSAVRLMKKTTVEIDRTPRIRSRA